MSEKHIWITEHGTIWDAYQELGYCIEKEHNINGTYIDDVELIRMTSGRYRLGITFRHTQYELEL